MPSRIEDYELRRRPGGAASERGEQPLTDAPPAAVP